MNTKNNFRLLTGSLLAFLLTMSLSTNILFAQTEAEKEAAEEKEMSWPHKLTAGLGGGANFNFARGGHEIDGNLYHNGNGWGPNFHAMLEIPIGRHFMFAPRASYSDLGVSYTDGVPAIANAASLPEFALNARILGVDILGKIVLDRFHFTIGPSISALLNNTWAHGNHDAANNSPNELPGANGMFAAAQGGIGYDAPLNSKNTMWLTPEIRYSYPLTDLGVDPYDISIQSIRGSLSLKFDVSGEEPAPPPPPARPLSVTVTAKGVLSNGITANEPVLPVNQTTTRTSMPLLPYVFFDDNSSAIPTRYSQNGATGFSELQLQGKDELEVNHSLLDIIGSRMKQYPEVSVRIVGTNSNTGSERHNLALSKARASALRDYLVNTWGVSANRIEVDARDLPQLPTNPSTQAGIEENRRAEIVDSHTGDPIVLNNENSAPTGETLIRYETSVFNPDKIGVASWRITLDNNGKQIGGAETGSGLPPAAVTTKIPNASAVEGKPLHYTLEVTDVNGKTYTGDGTTHVVKTVSDEKHLEKYAMFSFDFDNSVINSQGEKMISLISESINRDAQAVKINGFCDITGTNEYNQALSERRAQSAAAAIGAAAKMPANLSVSAHGSNDPKFTNELPEGRQLNRRVEVEITKSK